MAKYDTTAKARVPSALYEKVQESSTSVSDAIRNGLKMAAYGEKVAEAEEKNEVDRKQLEATRSDIDEHIEEFESGPSAFPRSDVIDALETIRDSRIEAVNQRIEERTQESETAVETRQEEELDDALADLERETVREPRPPDLNGPRVFPDHSSVKALAREFGLPPEEIIEKLRERNPDVPPQAFKSGGLGVPDWSGFSTKEAEMPVEDREPYDERGSISKSLESVRTDGGGFL